MKTKEFQGRACLEPFTYQMPMGCVKCKSLLECTNREHRHCEECLLFNLEAQGNCNEPGYGTLATNRACDRFKLKVENRELMKMNIEEWLAHELEALTKFELMALLYDYAEFAASGRRLNCNSSIEELADFVDNWRKHV